MKYIVRLPVYVIVEADNLASARARAVELANGLNVLPSLDCNSLDMTVWDEKSDQVYPKVFKVEEDDDGDDEG